MRYLFFELLLCLLLPAGRELAAQSRHDSLYKAVSESSCNIIAPMISDDGRWLTVRKRSWLPAMGTSDFDNDTILIFDARKPGKSVIASYRTAIRSLAFTGNNILILSDSLQTELLSLEKQTSIYYRDVKKAEALKGKTRFLLHYNKQENDRLELRDNDGKLLNSLDNVYRYYTTSQGHVYAVSETGKNEFKITLLNDSETEQLYETSLKIGYLDIDPDGQGLMIREEDPAGNSEEIVYLDAESKTAWPLKEVLPATIRRGFTDVIHEGNSYFVKTYNEKEKKADTIADIWYGNDNQIEEKFNPPVDVFTYIWEPAGHTIIRVGTDDLTTSFSIGSDRYFLSFDPSKFRDFTRDYPLLQMFVYDKISGQYSILDTIEPQLQLSVDGEYALSQKDKEWYLYHIASGNKKLIPGKDLGEPWFTDDGKAILFEGDGALWQYELNTGTLTEAAVFKGYRTSVVNNEEESLGVPHGSFNKAHVNLQRPLIIKLYDPQENVTSYVLWHKGKSEVIVPPTTGYIQNLRTDDTYSHFVFTEENYNLPPRLVYSETGRKEQVLYQSNKENSAIFSLRQEIISYTNSDGDPLKGILYYPLNYDPSVKYPMVVHIYEKQRKYSNLYPFPSYNDEEGFNIRLLTEKGYFVYLPDIRIQWGKGPGLNALDCVNKSLDALNGIQSIDKHGIGLIGHSFGGYETDFIATHSTRFAAYVSGSAHSDILRAYYSFNFGFQYPDHVRIESNQYKMGVPFSANKTLYFENNPIYYAENVNAPVLLWSGTEDQNVTSDNTMAFYIALRRNGKTVTMLFYKGEEHGLQNQQASFDLTCRILDWFDYYLKGDTGIEWISKGMTKGAR
jgi:dipeptidyl aminopeptidase/acylaminoacyl peptidase